MKSLWHLRSNVKKSINRYFELHCDKSFLAFDPNVSCEKPHDLLRHELFEIINHEFDAWKRQEKAETNEKLAAIICKIAKKSPELIKWKEDIKS